MWYYHSPIETFLNPSDRPDSAVKKINDEDNDDKNIYDEDDDYDNDDEEEEDNVDE